MMLATVRSVDSLPETRHLALRRFEVSSCFIELFLQWFHYVLYQDTGGMLGVVHTHRLGIGFRLHRFRFRFPYGSPQRAYRHNGSHQTSAEEDVQDFADIHAIHIFTVGIFLLT